MMTMGEHKDGNGGHINTLAPTKDEQNGQNGTTRKPSQISLASELFYSQKKKDSIISRNYSLRSSIAPLTDHKKETLYEKYTSCRWVVTYLTFVLLTLSVTLRQCMSMALVCMTQNVTSSYWSNQSNASTEMIDTSQYYVDWTYEQQGIVLSAYFYGFPITPVLGGYLSGKFGGKRVLVILMVIICVVSMATPIAAQTNIYLVVAIRIVVGLTSGGLPPSVAQVNSRWAPIKERAQMVAFVNSGMNVGNIITYTLSGLMCSIPLLGGWPFIFYIFGAANLLCLIPWIFCVYDNPMEHPRLKMREFAFIAKSRRDSTVIKMPDPPWVKIICSKAFWGLLIAHVSHGFLFTTIGTYLPIYMNAVLQYDIFENGVLSSLPFIGRFVGSILSGLLADRLISKRYLGVSTVRKLFLIFGFVGSSPFILWVSFLGKESRDLIVVLIVIYWTVQSTTNAGFRVNHLDIAPKFAGVLNGMTTSAASVAALLSPVITSEITKNGTREEWQIVFFICVGVAVVGSLVFTVIGSGEEQEWAKDDDDDIDINISVNVLKRKGSIDNFGFRKDSFDQPFQQPEMTEIYNPVSWITGNGGVNTNERMQTYQLEYNGSVQVNSNDDHYQKYANGSTTKL